MIYEAGQEGMGLANAGSAALASDPSVLMSNPAGIAKLKGTQISANAQVILGDLRFSRDDKNQFDGNEGGNARTVDRQYKDTWHASIGTQYQATRQLRWSVGLGYDSSAVDDKDRTVDNPMAETWRLATGINYQVEEGLDLHLAYTLVWLGDMDVEQTKSRSGETLSGTYNNAALHIIGGGATWRF